MEWKKPYLVQRLCKPHGSIVLNKMSFGCVQGGRLFDEAFKLLKDIWSFDYMGAAEYEFGDVPQALAKLVDLRNSKNYFSGYVKVKGEPVNFDKDGRKIYAHRNIGHTIEREVYIFCNKEHKDLIVEWLQNNVKNNEDGRTRNWTGANEAIFANENSDKRIGSVIGGLCIDKTPFIYLANKTSVEGFLKLFEI